MPWVLCIVSNIVLASLVALAAWFVQRRMQLPGIARLLWLLVLVKLVTPPLVRIPIVDLPGALACTLGACHCAHHEGTVFIIRNGLAVTLLVAWLVGGVARGVLAWRRWCYFQRLLACASPRPAQWQRLATRLSARLSIRRPPTIFVAAGRLPPFVVPGWRGARMLLPAELIGQLNRRQRIALLLHELSHLQRGDHWSRVLELVVGIAYWWLPFVGSIGRQLRSCEESCCDDAVVGHLPQARRDYARLLLDVIDFADPLPRPLLSPATGMSAAEAIEERLRAILHAAPKPQRRGRQTAFAVCLACAVLPCGLHYEFGGSRQSAASDSCDTAISPASLGDDLKNMKLATFCCPS